MATVVIVVAAASAMISLSSRLPDPATADRHELLRWIATRDLSREDHGTVEVLARRLDEEFGEGIDPGEIDLTSLDDARRARLAANVAQLLGPWLELKAATYAGIPSTRRSGWLDRTIDTLDVWKSIGLLDGVRSDGDSSGHESNTAHFAQQMDEAATQAPPALRQQIVAFVTDLRNRWIQRLQERLFGGAAWGARPSDG
jgi:hypothetical protein